MPSKPLPIIIAIIILLIAAGGLWYVLSRPSVPSEGTATSTPTAFKDVPEKVQDSGQYYDMSGAYPSITPLEASAGAVANAKAVQEMHDFVTSQMTQFKADAGLDHLTPEDIQIQGLSADRKYALALTYTTHSSPSTVTYVYQIYADTLGAHPNGYYHTFTYDLQTGAELSLADIFAGNDYLSILSKESRDRLPAILQQREQANPDLDMLNAGTEPTKDNFQTFYLEGPNLVLIFPPYQIGPYVLGTTELTIPRSEFGTAIIARYR
jgi:hypothetical protein